MTGKPVLVSIRPEGNAADVIGCLRRLADKIERGDVPARAAICIVEAPGIDEPPALYIWGPALPMAHLAGLCTFAQMKFLGVRRE